ALLDMTGEMTVEAWINPQSGELAGGGLISKMDSVQGGWFTLHNGALGRVSFYLAPPGGGGADISSPDGSVPQAQWSHVAFVASAGTMHIFVNGQEVASAQAPLLTPN